MSQKLDEKVTAIYNDCWKTYREYTKGHDMALYNKRNGELIDKYGRDQFLINLLYSFAPVVNALHAEYLTEMAGSKQTKEGA